MLRKTFIILGSLLVKIVVCGKPLFDFDLGLKYKKEKSEGGKVKQD